MADPLPVLPPAPDPLPVFLPTADAQPVLPPVAAPLPVVAALRRREAETRTLRHLPRRDSWNATNE